MNAHFREVTRIVDSWRAAPFDERVVRAAVLCWVHGHEGSELARLTSWSIECGHVI